jgi:hypothetical protein
MLLSVRAGWAVREDDMEGPLKSSVYLMPLRVQGKRCADPRCRSFYSTIYLLMMAEMAWDVMVMPECIAASFAWKLPD